MNISTPTLLFGSISLLQLAYTNRFFYVARLIRDIIEKQDGLSDTEKAEEKASKHLTQIPILKHRLHLIQWMQFSNIFAFILCAASSFALFLHRDLAGRILFGASIAFLLLALLLVLCEVSISTKALNIMIKSSSL